MNEQALRAFVQILESAISVWPNVEKVGFKRCCGICFNLDKIAHISGSYWVSTVASGYRGFSGNYDYPVKFGGQDPQKAYQIGDLYVGNYGRNRKNFAKYLVRVAKKQLQETHNAKPTNCAAS